MTEPGSRLPYGTAHSQLVTLNPFAEAWLADRELKPRTVAFYRSLLDQKILPELGDVPLKDITPQTVRTGIRA